MEHDPDDCDDVTLYRRPTEIESSELEHALTALALLGDDLYLRMQATNLAVVDPFIMGLEYEVLRKLLDEEHTPVPEATFLSAQSQMWIFAAYELLRTWRERSDKVIKWSANGHLAAKIAELEQDQGFNHTGRSLRAAQLRRVLGNQEMLKRIQDDLDRVYIPFRRIEFIRVALAKHEVAKQKNSVALAPGYGRINQWCGSLDYQMEKGRLILGTISRRDIADELRAMKGDVPTKEHLAAFDAHMDANFVDPFDEDAALQTALPSPA